MDFEGFNYFQCSDRTVPLELVFSCFVDLFLQIIILDQRQSLEYIVGHEIWLGFSIHINYGGA